MSNRNRIFLKISLRVLLVMVIGFLAYLLFDAKRNDDAYPVISLSSDKIYISVDADEDALLTGVSAFDAEDGDLTDSVIVENISQFVDAGKCIITYAVFDSANHVSTASREMYYTDYTSPRFQILGRLEFSYTGSFNPLSQIKAFDCIDGDISSKISMNLLDSDDNLYSIGIHKVEFRVMNSFGDSASIETEIIVNDATYTEQKQTPIITLTDYIVYVNRGDVISAQDYIKNIQVDGQAYSLKQYGVNNIEIDTSEFDSMQTGVQKIVFYVKNGQYSSSTKLIVCVCDDV